MRWDRMRLDGEKGREPNRYEKYNGIKEKRKIV